MASSPLKAFAILPMLALLVPQPAAAQFGLFRDVTRGATQPTDTSTDDGCKTEGGKRGKKVLGSILGGVAGRTASRAGFGFVPMSEFTDTLSAAIACRLNADEQKQAAEATQQIVSTERGGTANWTSTTRDNVSGSSTSSKPTQVAGGTKCVTVTDVIIVDGEETRAEKKMCRGPGEARYVLQA